jgi:hypothetical protein
MVGRDTEASLSQDAQVRSEILGIARSLLAIYATSAYSTVAAQSSGPVQLGLDSNTWTLPHLS